MPDDPEEVQLVDEIEEEEVDEDEPYNEPVPIGLSAGQLEPVFMDDDGDAWTDAPDGTQQTYYGDVIVEHSMPDGRKQVSVINVKDPATQICDCEMDELMRYGCLCGGLQAEKARAHK